MVNHRRQRFPIKISVPYIRPRAITFRNIMVCLLRRIRILRQAQSITFLKVVLSSSILLLIMSVCLLIIINMLMVIKQQQVSHTNQSLPSITTMNRTNRLIRHTRQPSTLRMLNVRTLTSLQHDARFSGSTRSTTHFVRQQHTVGRQNLVCRMKQCNKGINRARRKVISTRTIPHRLHITKQHTTRDGNKRHNTSMALSRRKQVRHRGINRQWNGILFRYRQIRLHLLRTSFFRQTFTPRHSLICLISTSYSSLHKRCKQASRR